MFLCMDHKVDLPSAASRWGRWRDILSHARCKRRLGERDVETICRVILVFCLLHYRGDENIKSFIWELITPAENGREPQTLLNHSGKRTCVHAHTAQPLWKKDINARTHCSTTLVEGHTRTHTLLNHSGRRTYTHTTQPLWQGHARTNARKLTHTAPPLW